MIKFIAIFLSATLWIYGDDDSGNLKGLTLSQIIDSSTNEYFGKFANPQEILNATDIDVIYRFAVNENSRKLNAFDLYCIVALETSNGYNCRLYTKYVSGGRILSEVSSSLSDKRSKDLISAIQYSEIFNIPATKNPPIISSGSSILSAQRIDLNGTKSIIRRIEESLPAKYIVEYLLRISADEGTKENQPTSQP